MASEVVTLSTADLRKLAMITLSGTMAQHAWDKPPNKASKNGHHVRTDWSDIDKGHFTRRWYLRSDAKRQIDRLAGILCPEGQGSTYTPEQLQKYSVEAEAFFVEEMKIALTYRNQAYLVAGWHWYSKDVERTERIARQEEFVAHAASMSGSLPQYLIRKSKSYVEAGKVTVDMTDDPWSALLAKLGKERDKLLKLNTRELFENEAANHEKKTLLEDHVEFWQGHYPDDYNMTLTLRRYGFQVTPLEGLDAAPHLHSRLMSSPWTHHNKPDLPGHGENLLAHVKSSWARILDERLDQVRLNYFSVPHVLMDEQDINRERAGVADLIAISLREISWSFLLAKPVQPSGSSTDQVLDARWWDLGHHFEDFMGQEWENSLDDQSGMMLDEEEQMTPNGEDQVAPNDVEQSPLENGERAPTQTEEESLPADEEQAAYSRMLADYHRVMLLHATSGMALSVQSRMALGEGRGALLSNHGGKSLNGELALTESDENEVAKDESGSAMGDQRAEMEATGQKEEQVDGSEKNVAPPHLTQGDSEVATVGLACRT